jgi:hypothetical protein
MPLLDADTSLSFKPLPKVVRQESCIGAEVVLPEGMNILDLEALTEGDKDNLRRALFRYQVVVIRNQAGIDPAVIPRLAKIFDPTASDVHSAGEKAVSDPRNILSAYKAGRIPRVPQVSPHLTPRRFR